MKVVGTMDYGTHKEPFATTLPTRELWIVYKQFPTGKIERVAAFFSEKNAREHAGSIVGKDKIALIGLETIPVNDEP